MEIERWTVEIGGYTYQDAEGDWVDYDDHERIVKELKEQIRDLAESKADAWDAGFEEAAVRYHG